MKEEFLNGRVSLYPGDNREVLKTFPDNSIHSIVCDPPYALVSIVKRFGGKNAAAVKVPEGGSGAYARASSGFMGQAWDTGETAFAVEFWAECLRVLKPGGHVVAFSGTRTVHRMVCAIEDAGFEIRDSIAWLYGSGFPKSHDVSKGIDRAAGAEREVVGSKLSLPGYHLCGHNGGEALGHGLSSTTYETRLKSSQITAPATLAAQQWDGWGTALKPALEPICLARKPLSEKTVAANVLKWGTGAINIDGCRVEFEDTPNPATNPLYRKKNGYALHTGDDSNSTSWKIKSDRREQPAHTQGRWPANIVHDGSEEVVTAFPETGISSGGKGEASQKTALAGDVYGTYSGATLGQNAGGLGDSGSASRFFYTAKADADDRLGSKHPTVKPVDLMQWLCRLITPPGGTVLDPFAGTGTTGEAAFREGFDAILIEREEEYQADIRRRMALCMSGPDERSRESIKAKTKDQPPDHGPLFAGAAG
jgi:DNA modification methylase